MSKSHPLSTDPRTRHGRVAIILRSRGFVPLPRLWVRSSDMPTIHAITEQYREEVNGVRAEVHNQVQGAEGGTQVVQITDEDADPRTDKDAAWKAAEQLRRTG